MLKTAEAADAIILRDIRKIYGTGEGQVHALDGVSLTIKRGEFVTIAGQSGSGKSTLMNILGCLDTPTSGEYILDGQLIRALSEKELARIRSREIGFIFQQFQLLPRMTAQKNVELPLVYAGIGGAQRAQRARQMLELVGLGDKLDHYPNQLSGGQQQRVAIARAMVTQPNLLLADEPTGALDQQTGRQVMQLFREINAQGHTIVMITHDGNIAKNASRIVKILDGQLSEGSVEDA